MDDPTVTAARERSRMEAALRKGSNWAQLAKFCAVGATGYVVNLGVFAVLVRALDLHYLPAAVGSFAVAVTNNYVWNRAWTFNRARGHVVWQGARFLLVSLASLGANLVVLALLVSAGAPEVPAQAFAIALVTPINFIGNKLWSFRH
jgi:putative flippase GtrA